VRIIAKEIDEAVTFAEEKVHMSEDEEDISQVDAEVSELIGREKPEATLRFGPSLVSAALLASYVDRGYFGDGICRAPKGEETPVPHDDECIVFRDFFVAGLRFPLDPTLPKLLARFKIKIHQLTPNAIVQLSKFFWAVKTFNGPICADAFCRLYELHPQGRNVRFEGEDETYSAQSRCCTFVPRRNNKTLKIERIELSYCQKNRWDANWAQYWFYAKIGFLDEKVPTKVSYPLASKVFPLEHLNQAEFRRSSAGYKDVVPPSHLLRG
jgi:hypothetical protein